MKKRMVTMLMVAAFALSTTACAKDTGETVEEDAVVEVSIDADLAINVAAEEAPVEASVEASDEDEAVEEESEEVSGEIGIIENIDDIDPSKVYKNDEFGVAIVIDDDMKFEPEDELGEGGDSLGANSDNVMLESFSYYNSVYVAQAESASSHKIIDAFVADLSEKMKYSEAAFVEMVSVRRKIEFEKEYSEVEVHTEEAEIMGVKHRVVCVTITENGRNAYLTEVYLIKDGRLMTVSASSAAKENADKLLGNLKRFK